MMQETTLSPKERQIIGWGCQIENRGLEPYCFTHFCPARDNVACLDAEDMGEQLLEERCPESKSRTGSNTTP